MAIQSSPVLITELKWNEIFVFGSNLSGIHGAGAAKLAFEKFNAEWGCGAGMTGQCYAIPTKSENIARTLSIAEIKPYVNGFIKQAKLIQGLVFLVTEIGCGLAGHKHSDIAPLFKEALNYSSIYLPQSFINIST